MQNLILWATLALTAIVFLTVIYYAFFRSKSDYYAIDKWFNQFPRLRDDRYLVIPRKMLNKMSSKNKAALKEVLDSFSEEWKKDLVDYTVSRRDPKTNKYKRDKWR